MALELKNSDNEKVRVGIRSNGTKYKVRKDRHEFFYPFQWKEFRNTFKLKNSNNLNRTFRPFKALIHTGARIDEILHTREKDVIEHGNQIHLWKTKTKAKKGETEGKPRSISVAPYFFKEIKSWSKDLKPDEFIFHKPNDKTKPMTTMAVYNLLKKHLKKTSLDPDDYSLHNIRKTHGRWLSVIGISEAKICSRLGHDMNTYLAHYSNPKPFTQQDVNEVRHFFRDIIIN